MTQQNPDRKRKGFTRRKFLRAVLAGGALGLPAAAVLRYLALGEHAQTFIGKMGEYHGDIAGLLGRGVSELGVGPAEISGKRILLKPNLVEPHLGLGHINTHPLVIRAAAETFLRLGAARVIVGEGPGHRRDTLLVLESSGLREVLYEDRIPFVDLNNDAGYSLTNAGRFTRLKRLTFSSVVGEVDWIVSLAKLKTHHWTGVTLGMKNLFGLMPGILYGWPKNVLHFEGITGSILDINATLKPHFAIVDGIVGMEGDGPIMGSPHRAGVLVMGRSLPAVDATCARIMGIDPHKIPYLAAADGWLGPIQQEAITQLGENIASVRTDFLLLDEIPAHRGLRLSEART